MILTSTSGYAQLITVLVIFVLVLAVTAGVTKWMANYQKGQNSGRNVEVIETTRVANNKWIQIIRVGETYKVIAVSKDDVTYLGDLDPEELKQPKASGGGFKNMLNRALKRTEKVSSDDDYVMKKASMLDKANIVTSESTDLSEDDDTDEASQ